MATETGFAEPGEANLHEATAWIESRLNGSIAALAAFAGRFRVTPGSVRLPWDRTFEVDFDLESLSDRSDRA